MNFTKIELLETLNKRVEQHIQIAVTQFQNQPNYILNRRSLTGGWSISQCLDHLNSYGDY